MKQIFRGLRTNNQRMNPPPRRIPTAEIPLAATPADLACCWSFSFLSVLAHGLAFTSCRCGSAVVAITPPPVQVSLLTPSTPET